jgi:hypothetical protein
MACKGLLRVTWVAYDEHFVSKPSGTGLYLRGLSLD